MITPQDLDAIRARDAALGSHPDGPDDARPQSFWSCAADRRALLAEVDRLTAQMDRLGWADNYFAGHNEGRAAERARIVEMIRDYDTEDTGWFIDHRDNLLRLLGERVEE